MLTSSSERKKGKQIIATWHLAKADEDYWVACEYAESSATIARPLGAQALTCRVEYDGNFVIPVAKTWSCSTHGAQ